MAEKIIVLLIVALAAVYIGRKFLSRKNRGQCSCGCAGCSAKDWDAAAGAHRQADEKKQPL
jgi:hypothetical protein